MDFQTKIKLPKYNHKIETDHKLLSIGSCFSQHIGQKLLDHKFLMTNNPFGTLFNPISIANTLNKCLLNDKIEITDIQENQNIFFHFDYHSNFNDLAPSKVVKSINDQIALAHDVLQETDWLIITLGTSIVYRHRGSGQIVANCHKVPQKEFQREFLPIDDMVSALASSIDNIKSIRPQAKIILTVSPVRHTKEGIVDNNRSKSRLIEVCHQLQNDDIVYFPSYELMMDELRDYRFYGADMLHPSDIAIEYIWQKFTSCLLTEKSNEKIKDIARVNKMEQHRPFHPESESHLIFLDKLSSEKKKLQDKYPEVKFKGFI